MGLGVLCGKEFLHTCLAARFAFVKHQQGCAVFALLELFKVFQRGCASSIFARRNLHHHPGVIGEPRHIRIHQFQRLYPHLFELRRRNVDVFELPVRRLAEITERICAADLGLRF